MMYVIFHPKHHNGEVPAGLTCLTKYGIEEHAHGGAYADFDGGGWFVEAHDEWPENRTRVNLLELTPHKQLPCNVVGISVADFMLDYYGAMS